MEDSAGVAPVGSQSVAVVVRIPAEVDLENAEDVQAELFEAVSSGAAVVIADMTGTTFTDSMGARALVLAHKIAAEQGAELRVAAPSPSVLRVLSMLKLDTYLSVYSTVAQAQHSGEHGAAGAGSHDGRARRQDRLETGERT
jgi:anti-anti-sigma factor